MGYKKGFDDERRVSEINTEQYMKSGKRQNLFMKTYHENMIKM